MIKANVLIHTCIPYTHARTRVSLNTYTHTRTHTCITEHIHTHTRTCITEHTRAHTRLSKKYIYWWFARVARVTLVIAFGFLPKILGGAGDLRMVLCHSMIAGSVVGTLKPYFMQKNFRREHSLAPEIPGETFTIFCFLFSWCPWNKQSNHITENLPESSVTDGGNKKEVRPSNHVIKMFSANSPNSKSV